MTRSYYKIQYNRINNTSEVVISNVTLLFHSECTGYKKKRLKLILILVSSRLVLLLLEIRERDVSRPSYRNVTPHVSHTSTRRLTSLVLYCIVFTLNSFIQITWSGIVSWVVAYPACTVFSAFGLSPWITCMKNLSTCPWNARFFRGNLRSILFTLIHYSSVEKG